MSEQMARRGPDDDGLWQDDGAGVCLGFRRLAILDLSPNGRQPMVSPSGRSVLVFNGEIYNFPELRRELEARGTTGDAGFRSSGDSEVLAVALETWGLDVLPRLAGMFAFAWYERESRRLTLARDRSGIKPLYLAHGPAGELAFGSQYDQVLGAPWMRDASLRPDVLALYLRLVHLPAPFCLHDGAEQLEPGAFVQWQDGDLRRGRFWTAPSRAESELGLNDGDRLGESLEKAVERHRLADVPLGVFLSGGVDSALVTAIARRQSPGRLKAFTLGNPGWPQDEEPMARRYAELLGVEHHVLHLTDGDWDQVFEEVVAAQHEPFGDFSIVPTLALSRFAREQVKVALSGDGGDEIFFGYERPRSLLRDGRFFRYPRAVRRGLYYAGRLGLGPKRSDVITFESPGDYYLAVHGRMSGPMLQRLAPELGALPGDFDLYRSPPFEDLRQLAHFSRHVELHGQLQRGLKKVDMASMFHGLEVRVPLLDPEILELGFRFDPMASLGDGERKRLLRHQLLRHVPADAVDRRKLGFSFPLADVLRRRRRRQVEETLLDGELFPSGIFRRSEIESLWREHLSGERDHKWILWTLLCLQWWAQRMKSELGPTP